MSYIRLQSCDDSTVFEMDLTPDEAAFLERISIETYRRGGGCKPFLTVSADRTWSPDDDEWVLSDVWRDDNPTERATW